MKFSEFFSKFKEEFSNQDLSQLPPFLAIQINIKGDEEEDGTFYIEIKDQQLHIEPYAYEHRDVAVTISQKHFDQLVHGKLDPIWAFTSGKLKAEGDLGKALELKKLMK